MIARKYDIKINKDDSGTDSSQTKEMICIVSGYSSDATYFNPSGEDSAEPEGNSGQNEVESTIVGGDGAPAIALEMNVLVESMTIMRML